MTVEEVAIALDRAMSAIDAPARDAGHAPAWDVYDDGHAARCSCDRCDETAAVRVMPDGKTWKAGRLRLVGCVGAA